MLGQDLFFRLLSELLMLLFFCFFLKLSRVEVVWTDIEGLVLVSLCPFITKFRSICRLPQKRNASGKLWS